MTSRRAIKHWEQKLSRALQFQPGHVGGRVPSAQPVTRHGGTVSSSGRAATAAGPGPAVGLSDGGGPGDPLDRNYVDNVFTLGP